MYNIYRVLTDIFGQYTITVKPADEVTSIKQSPVLKGHHFLASHRKFHMN